MKLFFRKYGSGKPLIILHGLFGSSDNWNTLAKKYGEFFTTYVVDLRNHGQSPHHSEWNYEVMAEDVAELIQTEQLEDVSIMGHSMGGKVTMFLAGMIPERIAKLIISDIAPKYYPPHHHEIIEALLGLPLDSISSRKEAEHYMAEKIINVGIQQFLLKNLYWNENQLAWRFNVEVIAQNIENVGAKLPQHIQFDRPVLFIRGSNSHYIEDEDLELIQHHFPQAELKTIANAGHWIHAEKPLEYLEATINFLK